MNQTTLDYLGFVAGILTTISFLPQVIRIYQIKSGREISLSMVLLLTSGVSLWLVYGLYMRSMPIVMANLVTLLLVLAILLLKLYYARKSREQ